MIPFLSVMWFIITHFLYSYMSLLYVRWSHNLLNLNGATSKKAITTNLVGIHMRMKWWHIFIWRDIITRAYFSHLLCAVYAHNALFVELNSLFSTKNSKNTWCLEGCSIINVLNLKKWVVKIHNSAILLDFFAHFVLYRMHALIF